MIFKLQILRLNVEIRKLKDIWLDNRSCQSGGIEVKEKVRAMQPNSLGTPISTCVLTKYRYENMKS